MIMEKWTNQSLYHYTSFDALEGMLVNKEIWLGNLKFMNDRLEMMYFFEALKKAVEECVPYNDKVEDLFDRQLKRFEGMTSYAFSLTRSFEDAAQWDRYADAGQGVCVKFNAEKLNNIIKEKAVLQPVYYAKDMFNHQITGLIVTYLLDGEISYGFNSIDEVFENAWAVSMAFKHPSFRIEEEVRVCTYPIIYNSIIKNTLVYKASANGLREYYPIGFCDKSNNGYGGVIEEIILGNNSGVDIDMFNRYAKYKNVDVSNIRISKSDCPLR